AVLCAMARKLEKYGCSFLDLANHIENGSGLSDADKQKIRSEIENARAIGYAEGVKAAESKQHGTGAFRNTDGTLEWSEVALFCQRQSTAFPRSITNSSTTWHRARCGGANQPRNNTSTCIAFSTSSEAKSHERAG